MEVSINSKILSYDIYRKIIFDSLKDAHKYTDELIKKLSPFEPPKELLEEIKTELSNQYLKVIDELIQCINEKHKKDFIFEPINYFSPCSLRSLFIGKGE